MTRPSPSATRSHAASAGCLHLSPRRSPAMVMPSYRAFPSLRALTSTMPSQPPEPTPRCSTNPRSLSRLRRFNRSRTSGRAEASHAGSRHPPSAAQLGIVASRPVPPAVYGIHGPQPHPRRVRERAFDLDGRLLHDATPPRLVRALVVEDLDRHAGALSDLDRFPNGRDESRRPHPECGWRRCRRTPPLPVPTATISSVVA